MRWLLLVALIGCSKPEQADCTTVGNGVKKYWDDRAAQTTDPEELAAIAEAKKTGVEKFERHCRADHWNPEMIACARAVFRLDDSGCFKFMSTMQRQKLQAGEEAPPIQGGMGIGN